MGWFHCMSVNVSDGLYAIIICSLFFFSRGEDKNKYKRKMGICAVKGQHPFS